MRIKINLTKVYVVVAKMIVNSEICQFLVTGSCNQPVNELRV